jgi:glutamate/aspartate transport system permease protein
MNYNWNWGIFWEPAADGSGTWLDTLWLGLGTTLTIALTAWVMALLLGAVVGTLRTLPQRGLVWLGNAYVELFRNIPLLVQMFLWYFVVPELLPAFIGDWIKARPDSALIIAIVSLGFFTSARVAVQVSAGIESIPRGQKMAGTAIGLTLAQTYRYILLPVALRVIFPPLTSEFLNIMKNSSVAFTITVAELTARTYSMREMSFQTFEALTAATVIYVLINIVVLLFMKGLGKAIAIPGFLGQTGGR